MHQALKPWSATSGPKRARIMLIGEAWGQAEQETRRPFVGESGKELWRMLGEALPDIGPEAHAKAMDLHRYGNAWIGEREQWLEEASICMTNVLALRPPSNKIEDLCGPKGEMPEGYQWPALAKAKYLRPEYLGELERLEQEIAECQPNLIVALGNTALWALCRVTNIGSVRGAITQATNGRKVLPTYHPAGVLRNWSWRTIVVTDLAKAAREGQFPEIRRPRRGVIVNPTLQEINQWVDDTIIPGIETWPMLACDIETEVGQIKCVGFARSRTDAIVIPFMQRKKAGGSYWDSIDEELSAWKAVEALLESVIPKLFQNGLYDLQYLTRMGLRINMALGEDTMLRHHSLFPEMLKGLGFLGSVYTSEPAWKLMRTQKTDTEKRDE